MSNLLDKASIVLTPTAYNNGEALCVKPSDGSGDFDFSRNSAATRVNAQGLVENVQILSSNLVQNGDFSEEGAEKVSNGSFYDGETDWIFGTGWSVGENKATVDNTVNANLDQTCLTSGKIYKVSFEISDLLSGGIFVGDIVNPGAYDATSNGSHTFYYTATNSTLRVRGKGYPCSITNISVKEVGQNWDLLNGTITDKYNASLTSYQNGIRVNPFTYTGTVKVTFDLVVTSGSCKFVAGGSNEQIYSTSGTKEIIVTNPSRFEFNAFNLGWVGTLDNVSAIQITDDTNLPRINYEGFSYQDALGSELVVNGGFDTNLNNWVAYSNTLISWESGGYALLDSNNNFWCKIKQSNVFEIGKTYKVILTAKSDRTDLPFHNSPIIGSFSEADTFETFEQYYTATSTEFLFGYANAGSATITIDNVSVKEYLGQEVVPDSGCGSWLFEPQSTNLITYSQDFTQWTQSRVTITNNEIVSPDGTTNASLITEDLTLDTRYFFLNLNVTTNQHSLSFFAKNNGQYLQVLFGTSDTTGNVYINFDLENGTYNNNGVTNPFIEDFGNGWWKISLQVTPIVTSDFGVLFSPVPSLTSSRLPSYQGDGTSGFYIWGAQLEAQDFATSLIPTDGSQTTRNQDVCTNGGSLASINSTEGVLYAEIAALADNDNGYIGLFGSSNSRVRIVFSNQIKAQLFNGSYQCNIGFTQSQTNNNKIAFKYKENDFALWINGVEVGTDTSGLTFSANTLSYLNLGGYDGALNLVKGKTKCVAVFPYLSDSELQSLTTI